MATGALPFAGDTSGVIFDGILNRAPVAPVRLNPQVLPRLEELINKALEKDPRLRCQSAAEMRADLERLRRDSSSGRVAMQALDSGLSGPGTILPSGSSGTALAGRHRSSSFRKLVATFAAVLVLVVAGGIYAYRAEVFSSGMAATAFQNATISSLSSTGDVMLSRISADGHYLAYVSNQSGRFSLWVRQIATPSAVQVVSARAEIIGNVSFTPDDGFIDYTTSSVAGADGTLYQVPVLGGTPRLLLDKVDTALSFSPDGKQMTYAVQNVQTSKIEIMVAKPDGSALHKVSEYAGSAATGNYAVAWSPDGKRIVALNKSGNDASGLPVSLIEIDPLTGAQKTLAGRHWRDVRDFSWLPDGSGILLAAMEKTAANIQLWITEYPSGKIRRVSNDLSDYLSVAAASDGQKLASVQRNMSGDVWVGPASAPDKSQQITTGRLDGVNGGLTFRPDDQLVYVKNRLRDTDILQEYFIPYDRMPEFVDGLRTSVQQNKANLLNVTIRAVHKDMATALPYAKEDMFGFVLYFNVRFTDKDNEILRKTTSDLIDVAERSGGTYYLPYQLFYSKEQLAKSYPEIENFFAVKKKYDLISLFSNKFYEKYGM
jgi:Tol biopolymer transport system component